MEAAPGHSRLAPLRGRSLPHGCSTGEPPFCKRGQQSRRGDDGRGAGVQGKRRVRPVLRLRARLARQICAVCVARDRRVSPLRILPVRLRVGPKSGGRALVGAPRLCGKIFGLEEIFGLREFFRFEEIFGLWRLCVWLWRSSLSSR